MACGTSRVARTAWRIVDLQVAEIPWTTNVEGLGTRGFRPMEVSHFHHDSRLQGIVVGIVNSHLKDWLAAASEHRDKAIVCSMSWQPLLVA